MKRIPKSIVIFGRKIPIKTLSSKDIIKLYPDYQHAPQGLWDSCNEWIVINKDFNLKSQHYTLAHEIAHSVNTFNGVDLIIDPSIQEILAQSTATLIQDILKQADKLHG